MAKNNLIRQTCKYSVKASGQQSDRVSQGFDLKVQFKLFLSTVRSVTVMCLMTTETFKGRWRRQENVTFC